MIGEYDAIYCDHCERLEDFYYTVFVKKEIKGGVWTAWWEICKKCLADITAWNTEKRTGEIIRRSNLKRLGKKRFLQLLDKQKGEQPIVEIRKTNPFGFSPLKC